MSPKKLKPGVFVQELDHTAPTCVWPAVAMPVFIGYTEKTQHNGKDLTLSPIRIDSMESHRDQFGGPASPQSLELTLDRSGKPMDLQTRHRFVLDYALQMFFANGGNACYVISVGDYGQHKGPLLSHLRSGLGAVRKLQHQQVILVCPDASSLDVSELGAWHQAALKEGAATESAFSILDIREDADVDRNVAQFRFAVGLNDLEYGAAYTPFLKTNLELFFQYGQISFNQNGQSITLRELCERAGVDARDVEAYDQAIADSRSQSQLDRHEQTLRNNNPLYQQCVRFISQASVSVPPSGAVAAAYDNTDRNRGIWKAPANIALRRVSGLTQSISNQTQDGLNVDPTHGLSVNAIRDFDGRGVLIWGARTLAGNHPENRYVPVVRTSMMMKQSIEAMSSWIALQDNTAATWTQIHGAVTSMLHDLWQQGALMGAKPAEAYVSSVGLGLTMTAQDIQQGLIRLDVGFAPLKPAEFVIQRFVFKTKSS